METSELIPALPVIKTEDETNLEVAETFLMSDNMSTQIKTEDAPSVGNKHIENCRDNFTNNVENSHNPTHANTCSRITESQSEHRKDLSKDVTLKTEIKTEEVIEENGGNIMPIKYELNSHFPIPISIHCNTRIEDDDQLNIESILENQYYTSESSNVEIRPYYPLPTTSEPAQNCEDHVFVYNHDNQQSNSCSQFYILGAQNESNIKVQGNVMPQVLTFENNHCNAKQNTVPTLFTASLIHKEENNATTFSNNKPIQVCAEVAAGCQQQTATELPKYRCEICSSRFRHNCSLKKHQKIKHPGINSDHAYKPIKCCKVKFETIETWKEHLTESHQFTTIHFCGECNCAFPNKTNLEKHKFENHLTTRDGTIGSGVTDPTILDEFSSCEICNARFTSKSSLLIHLGSQHGINHEQQYKPRRCCEEMFETIETWKEHLKKSHEKCTMRLCRQCDFACAFPTIKRFEEHLLKKHTYRITIKKHFENAQLKKEPSTSIKAASGTRVDVEFGGTAVIPTATPISVLKQQYSILQAASGTGVEGFVDKAISRNTPVPISPPVPVIVLNNHPNTSQAESDTRVETRVDGGFVGTPVIPTSSQATLGTRVDRGFAGTAVIPITIPSVTVLNHMPLNPVNVLPNPIPQNPYDQVQKCKAESSCAESLMQQSATKHSLHCEFCNRKFINLDELESHNKNWCCEEEETIQNNSCVRKCDLCNVEFDDIERLTEHTRVSHSVFGLFKCGYCKKSFYTLAELEIHKNIGNDCEFWCSYCETSYPSKTRLLIHEIECHGEADSSVEVCFKCGNIYQRKYSLLAKHVNKIHYKRSLALRYECGMCKRKFSFGSRLVTHLRFHLGLGDSESEKSYLCEHCGRKFSHYFQLSNHARIHTDNTTESKMYYCDCKCNFKCDRRAKMTTNIAKSHEKWPKKCLLCDLLFHCPNSLRKHRNEIHLGAGDDPGSRNDCASSYEISDENGTNKCHLCDLSSHSLTSLRKHQDEIHLRAGTGSGNDAISSYDGADENQPKNKCFLCDLSFHSLFSLRTHRNEIHLWGDGPSSGSGNDSASSYECADCGEKFSLFSDLTSHIMQVHHNTTTDHKPQQSGNSSSDLVVENSFECSDCGRLFSKLSNLKAHVSRIHDKNRSVFRRCHLCRILMKNADALRNHLRVKHKLAQCTECELIFSSNESLTRHMVSAHPDAHLNPVNEEVYMIEKNIDPVKKKRKIQ